MARRFENDAIIVLDLAPVVSTCLAGGRAARSGGRAGRRGGNTLPIFTEAVSLGMAGQRFSSCASRFLLETMQAAIRSLDPCMADQSFCDCRKRFGHCYQEGLEALLS